MKVGLVGLGRMGRAIHGRLAASGFDVIGWDRDGAAAKAAAEQRTAPRRASARGGSGGGRGDLDHHRG